MTTTFPVVDNAIEPSYKLTLETDPVKGETGLITIEGSGKLYEERNIDDFIRRSPFSLIIEDDPVMNEEGHFRLIKLSERRNFTSGISLPRMQYHAAGREKDFSISFRN